VEKFDNENIDEIAKSINVFPYQNFVVASLI